MINQEVRGANIGRSCVYHAIFLKDSPADILQSKSIYLYSLVKWMVMGKAVETVSVCV